MASFAFGRENEENIRIMIEKKGELYLKNEDTTELDKEMSVIQDMIKTRVILEELSLKEEW